MTFQDFLMNSPDGGLMIKVGDGTPIGGLPPWIASDPVNGGLMFKVNNTGGGGSVNPGVLQVSGGVPLSLSLTNITDQSGNTSTLWLSTTTTELRGVFALNNGTKKVTFDYAGIAATDKTITIPNATGTMALTSDIPSFTGFLKLGAALDGTLRAVTDYANTASPLQLSTTQVLVNSKLTINNTLEGSTSGRMNIVAQYDLALVAGNSASGVGGVFVGGASTAPTARLQVRGDGTNPIFRTEDNSGNAAGIIAYNTRLDIYGRNFSSNEYLVNIYNGLSWGATSGTVGFLNLANTNFGAGAGSANFRPLSITYTINNSGAQTGTATGIFLNATETALNSMTHNLMDLQVGGITRFKVLNSGGIQAEGTSTIPTARMGFINDPTNAVSIFSFTNTTGATLFGGSIFRFNGATNAFPALKNSGAELRVILADDLSGYANLRANAIYAEGGLVSKDNTSLSGAGDGRISFKSWGNMVCNVSDNGVAIVQGSYTANVASSILELTSTTKGFLPPRMTTTQRDNIATPAEGLVIYNTTTQVLNFYNGSAWGAV